MVTVEVDPELCISDEICASMEPDIFEMGDDGFAHPVDGMEELEDEALIAAAKDAADACPVDAISVNE